MNGTEKAQQIGSLRSDERNLMRDMLDTEPKQTAWSLCQIETVTQGHGKEMNIGFENNYRFTYAP